jgi:hypothetical protein
MQRCELLHQSVMSQCVKGFAKIEAYYDRTNYVVFVEHLRNGVM